MTNDMHDAGATATARTQEPSPELAVFGHLCRALLAFRGEAAVVTLAEQIVRRYPRLTPADRRSWHRLLLDELGADPAAVQSAVDAYRTDRSPAAVARLAAAAEPRRQELLRRINTAVGGTATVVSMRADLLGLTRAEPELSVVDDDFAHLLRSWFNRGFLTLERISWSSPAGLLERLIRYEAVHEIRSWDDLRRRLADDRRCYGFFHPSLPEEPLIFIEVALTDELSASVQTLLAPPAPPAATASVPDDASSADTAIFYSITNCQPGLAGIPFGDLLIKQVAATISAEMPSVTRFSTLSPIPGLRRWLAAQPADAGLESLAAGGWQAEADDPRRRLLLHRCAHYLLEAKQGAWPADPVARFHLRNGARVQRINWMGDTSAKGIAESAGLMVNYAYVADEIEANHEAFLNAGAIAASDTVRALLAPPAADE